MKRFSEGDLIEGGIYLLCAFVTLFIVCVSISNYIDCEETGGVYVRSIMAYECIITEKGSDKH